jgi:hypothetical protein
MSAAPSKPKVVKPKVNPFGSATAVNTASKMAKLDVKEKEAPKETEPIKEKEEPVTEEPKKEEALPQEPEKKVDDKEPEKEAKPDDKRKEKKKREPQIVNSRAAALEAAPAHEVIEFTFIILHVLFLYSPASISVIKQSW